MLKLTPFEIVYGRRCKSQIEDTNSGGQMTPEEMQKLENQVREMRRQWKHKLTQKTEQPNIIAVGDTVWWLPPKYTHKFEDNVGPFRRLVEPIELRFGICVCMCNDGCNALASKRSVWGLLYHVDV